MCSDIQGTPPRPHAAGPPGADATALLPPTDGSLQLLLQPHCGAVSVAANAQLLPLQVSVPAVAAVSAVVGALFPGEEQQQQQQPAVGHRVESSPASPRSPPPSAAAVAAAATVIIEDASTSLRPHGRGASLDAGSNAAAAAVDAPGGQAEQAVQQPGDDLAAALFTLVHSSGLGSRPGPLQVHTFSGSLDGSSGGGSEAATGLGARLWAAAGGSSGRQESQQPSGAAAGRRLQGIRWCYPQPREVALLAVEVRLVAFRMKSRMRML